jgi:hypothetical protein
MWCDAHADMAPILTTLHLGVLWGHAVHACQTNTNAIPKTATLPGPFRTWRHCSSAYGTICSKLLCASMCSGSSSPTHCGKGVLVCCCFQQCCCFPPAADVPHAGTAPLCHCTAAAAAGCLWQPGLVAVCIAPGWSSRQRPGGGVPGRMQPHGCTGFNVHGLFRVAGVHLGVTDWRCQ